MNRSITLIALLFSTLAFASTQQEVHIGLASNFSEVSTGSSNPYGAYFKDGVMLALKNSEWKLKRKGIKIVLDEFDYGNSDIKVLDATRKAIASNAVAVLGYNYSSNALLAAPLHQEAKLPMLTPSASANRLGSMGRYIHMSCFDNAFMAETLAKFAITKLHAKRAIILPAADCAYCSDLGDSFEKNFTNHGGTVVMKVPVLLEDKDFSSVINRIKDEKYDVVFIPNQELISARMIAALARANIHATFLGADGWGNVGQEFFEILRGVSFVGYSVSHWDSALKDPASAAFVKQYSSRFQKTPNDTAVLSYDSMLLMIHALLNAKSYTREGVENALNSITHFSGVTGQYVLSPNKAPRKSIVLLKSNGTAFMVMDRINPQSARKGASL